MKITKDWSTILLPFIFFFTLLAVSSRYPEVLVFDEVHYIPSAKALVSLQNNLNWIHPPLGKIILGIFGYLFHDLIPLFPDPMVYRICTSIFGLLCLWALVRFMRHLKFGSEYIAAALWITGFNFIWFVQSRTAMLDILYLAPAMHGLFDVFAYSGDKTQKQLRGWILLGLALAIKWATIPFVLLALVFSNSKLSLRLGHLFLMGMVYAACFIPLTLLPEGFVAANLAIGAPPKNIFQYHLSMIAGFEQMQVASHPYQSKWFTWPLMIRPVWYAFETAANGNQRMLWMAGNPVLFWFSIPIIFAATYYGLRKKDRIARAFVYIYWGTLLFWALSPRKLTLFYYYLASSMWIGPLMVWSHMKFLASKKIRVKSPRMALWGFVALMAVVFLYFLPLLDARVLKGGLYYHYMYFKSWL